MAELKEILEALIFVHRGVLTGKVIEGVLKDSFSPEEIAGAMEEMKKDCEGRARMAGRLTRTSIELGVAALPCAPP